jgi:hypothetical protein
MKVKQNKKRRNKITQADLEAVAAKLKGKELFPKKMEEVRNLLKNTTTSVTF